MPARSSCSNPSPSLTPAYFLKQILCYLRQVFGDPATPGTLAAVVSINQATPGTTNGVQVNAALPAGTNSIGGTKDNGPQWTVARLYTAITTATTTDITAAPTSGQKIVLDDCLISCDAACAVSIVEETSGTVFAKVFIPANGTVQVTLRDALKTAVVNKKLRAITSAAVNCSITTCYHSEA